MITFQNKVALNENPDIPEVNKITDDNINDLKAGINTNENNISILTNELNDYIQDISDEFQTSYTKNYIKALYFPKVKMVVLTYSIQGITTSSNWTTFISTSNDRYKANADYYNAAYSSTATFGAVGIANNTKNIIGYQKGMFMGTLVWYTN